MLIHCFICRQRLAWTVKGSTLHTYLKIILSIIIFQTSFCKSHVRYCMCDKIIRCVLVNGQLSIKLIGLFQIPYFSTSDINVLQIFALDALTNHKYVTPYHNLIPFRVFCSLRKSPTTFNPSTGKPRDMCERMYEFIHFSLRYFIICSLFLEELMQLCRHQLQRLIQLCLR